MKEIDVPKDIAELWSSREFSQGTMVGRKAHTFFAASVLESVKLSYNAFFNYYSLKILPYTRMLFDNVGVLNVAAW